METNKKKLFNVATLLEEHERKTFKYDAILEGVSKNVNKLQDLIDLKQKYQAKNTGARNVSTADAIELAIYPVIEANLI